MVDFTAKTVWNMDESRMKAVDYYLSLCETAFINWNLEELYIYLKQVRRMISGKISEEQFKKCDDMLQDMEKIRRSINIDNEQETKKKKSELYEKADELYVYLNRLMKKHGMFFKEGDDPTRAALKR